MLQGDIMKDNSEKVSIIIPAYNSEKTIMACYNSILKQTYKNFEVITINDGSTDKSLDIIKEMSEKDNRFIFVDTENGGVSRARNLGVKIATGKYIQFIDADDTIHPTMIEKMVGLIENNNAELAVCRFTHPYFKSYVKNDIYDLTNKRDLLRICQDPFALVVPWNKMWRRDAFTELFDEEVKFSEDELCALANLPNVKRVATTKDVLYNYYIPAPNSPALKNSCIGRIINSVNNLDYHSTFYWLGEKLLTKRKNIIKNAIKNNKLAIKEKEDLCYIKLLDYAFYTLSIYIANNVSQNALVKDFMEMFCDQNFLDAFKAQEKYGFRLKQTSIATRLILVEKFVHLCYKTFKAKKFDKNFKMDYAFMMIFLSLFTEQVGKLDEINLNSIHLLNLQNSSTKEANYIKGILEDDIVLNDNISFPLNYCLA